MAEGPNRKVAEDQAPQGLESLQVSSLAEHPHSSTDGMGDSCAGWGLGSEHTGGMRHSGSMLPQRAGHRGAGSF